MAPPRSTRTFNSSESDAMPLNGKPHSLRHHSTFDFVLPKHGCRQSATSESRTGDVLHDLRSPKLGLVSSVYS